jgi:hypothetical protein
LFLFSSKVELKSKVIVRRLTRDPGFSISWLPRHDERV